ncbi:hypothetical protein LTR36_006770 [Oleoguttula mirabilis]|uniref:Uncharacterized protein n=1 Tax=Oleoguttula mirabilis TaxID=1507867 RepID=A0AAV9JDQ4_9PEZI|nr:hypothetical protein LTR36_006770 [Oleoguttula mirabilis]
MFVINTQTDIEVQAASQHYAKHSLALLGLVLVEGHFRASIRIAEGPERTQQHRVDKMNARNLIAKAGNAAMFGPPVPAVQRKQLKSVPYIRHTAGDGPKVKDPYGLASYVPSGGRSGLPK